MGRHGGGVDDEKDAGLPTKKKFRGVWSDIYEATEDRWLLNLRDCANLIGMCVYPVGWAWEEYDLQTRETPATWEKRAQKVCSIGTLLDEPIRDDGTTAFKNGMRFRRARVKHLLMRMIKRKEISVTIYDHRMQGYEIDDRMRLDATLQLDVTRGIIGFNELIRDDAWDCRVDAKSLLRILENHKGWELKSGTYDWLKIERYARCLYELRGVPDAMSDYTTSTNIWYGQQFEDEQREPPYSSAQEMMSKLHKEYSS